MPENMQFEWQIFTQSTIAHIAVDFKNVARKYQEKNEAIRMTSNITITSKHFHIQYRN